LRRRVERCVAERCGLAKPARALKSALQSARLAARWFAERRLATIGRPLQIGVRRNVLLDAATERNGVRVIPLDAKCFMDA